jgi:hypothetical protein
MAGQMGENHFGTERWERAEERAARIVREELNQAGWTEEHLALKPKGDPVKLAVAIRLRKDDSDAQMDQPTVADGHLDTLEQAIVRAAQKPPERLSERN